MQTANSRLYRNCKTRVHSFRYCWRKSILSWCHPLTVWPSILPSQPPPPSPALEATTTVSTGPGRGVSIANIERKTWLGLSVKLVFVQDVRSSSSTSRRCSVGPAGYQNCVDHCFTAKSACEKGEFEGTVLEYFFQSKNPKWDNPKWDSVRVGTVTGYLMYFCWTIVIVIACASKSQII